VFKIFRVLLGAGLAIGIWAGLGVAAQAQTISQSVGTTAYGSTINLGQSFTATTTGTVTQINVRSRGAGGYFLHLYNGGAGSGVSGGIGTPAYGQAVTLTAFPDNLTGFNTLLLATPFPVIQGQQYSFTIDNNGGGSAPPLAGNGANPYAGGGLVTFGNSVSGVSDLVFQIYETPTPPIPTLSEWAMILFGVILAGGAALLIQRRQITV